MQEVSRSLVDAQKLVAQSDSLVASRYAECHNVAHALVRFLCSYGSQLYISHVQDIADTIPESKCKAV